MIRGASADGGKAGDASSPIGLHVIGGAPCAAIADPSAAAHQMKTDARCLLVVGERLIDGRGHRLKVQDIIVGSNQLNHLDIASVLKSEHQVRRIEFAVAIPVAFFERRVARDAVVILSGLEDPNQITSTKAKGWTLRTV